MRRARSRRTSCPGLHNTKYQIIFNIILIRIIHNTRTSGYYYFFMGTRSPPFLPESYTDPTQPVVAITWIKKQNLHLPPPCSTSPYTHPGTHISRGKVCSSKQRRLLDTVERLCCWFDNWHVSKKPTKTVTEPRTRTRLSDWGHMGDNIIRINTKYNINTYYT